MKTFKEFLAESEALVESTIELTSKTTKPSFKVYAVFYSATNMEKAKKEAAKLEAKGLRMLKDTLVDFGKGISAWIYGNDVAYLDLADMSKLKSTRL